MAICEFTGGEACMKWVSWHLFHHPCFCTRSWHDQNTGRFFKNPYIDNYWLVQLGIITRSSRAKYQKKSSKLTQILQANYDLCIANPQTCQTRIKVFTCLDSFISPQTSLASSNDLTILHGEQPCHNFVSIMALKIGNWGYLQGL